MRIGFYRPAQKSCSKHLQQHRHASQSTIRRSFCRLPRNGFDRYRNKPQVLHHAFKTTAWRPEESGSELRQQEETIETDPSVERSRPKREYSVRSGIKARGGMKNPALKGKRKDPDTWSSMLNDFYLRAGAHSLSQHSSGLPLPHEDIHIQILDIMYESSKPYNAGVDLFTYMGIKQGRWKAVLWTANTLLQNVSTRTIDPRNAGCPSNVVWGSEETRLRDLTRQAFSVEALAYTKTKSVADSTKFEVDPKYSDLAAANKDRRLRTLKQIWKSLGALIIEAAELPEDQSQVVMAVVYQIIAKVHALGLVPDNVYSYASSPHSTMVSRPPILLLLSSRVLTTLSDATWRSHQMDVIEQALSLGTPMESLVKDLPGGRFRLKVRPLGPEIWLEFVLWCCVEGGFGSVGTHIINRLQEKTQNPWFAIPWESQTGNALSSTVDWDRVRTRHGGSVGLIEGYNREPPFVEMPPRTVSAEVVLMLVETMVNSVNTGVSGRSISMHSVASKAIPSLIEFLEPHSLPGDYFDYIAVRLLQTGAFDVEHEPAMLERWVEKVSRLRSLESTYRDAPVTATFEISSIVKQSEVYAGMLHQAMEAHVERFDVRSAVAVFNRIQELVDVSKLQSISAFLATTTVESKGFFNSQEFFSSHTLTNNVDFLRSHGQLPLHKLASFLNLTTDSKLLRIGQWMLYSEDIDEPAIPQRLYGRPSLTAALVRFAAVSGDEKLVAELIRARRSSPLLPSVSLLRSLVDALVSNYNFQEAHRILLVLRKAQGGGYGPKNVASSAAAILGLETHKEEPGNVAADTKLGEAWHIVSRMMAGYYDGRTATLRIDIITAYRQQMAALLTILSAIPESQISSFARRWQNNFPLNNFTILATDTFNIILAGVVDTKGSSDGMRLWRLFCGDPLPGSNTFQDLVQDDIAFEEHTLGDDDDYSWSRQQLSMPDRAVSSGEHVPFVGLPTDTQLEVGNKRHESLVDSVDQLQSCQSDFGNAFPVVASGSEDTGPESRSLVRPDLRTLRIIVQGALAERGAREEQGLGTSSQTAVLEWATQFYRQFGTSTEIIQQEIQQPVQNSVSDIEEQRRQTERGTRIAVAAASSKASTLGEVYKQFHGWRPWFGPSRQAGVERTRSYESVRLKSSPISASSN